MDAPTIIAQMRSSTCAVCSIQSGSDAVSVTYGVTYEQNNVWTF